MQPGLFDAPRPRNPIARTHDPATSHAAAAEVTASGRRDAQAAAVLEAVRALPGRTSAELALARPLDRYVAARRLSELERLGLVRRDVARRCGATGRAALTWWPR